MTMGCNEPVGSFQMGRKTSSLSNLMGIDSCILVHDRLVVSESSAASSASEDESILGEKEET